ncbi:MAG: hypothetical protein EZS28_018726, partial [Streblomastix strix]
MSSIDGMSTVTGASFVKSGADNTVVLLGADGDVQDIQGILRKTILDQPYPEPTDDDYVTLGAVKSEFVSSIYSDSINGNQTATQFFKSGGTYQQVLLANGTTKLLSEFASGNVDDSNYVKKTGQELQIIHGVLRRDDDELSMSDRYDNQTIYGTKTFNSNINAAGFAKTGKDDTSVLLADGGDRLLSNFSSGGASIEDLTSQVAINVTATVEILDAIQQMLVGFNKQAFLVCSKVYIDEALLDAAGLSEFPELYAYIHEREPKRIVDGIANQIIVGPQYLQDQVKDIDDKLNVQPIPQPIVPIEISQVQIFKIPKSQLAANVQMYNPADEYFYFYKLRNKVVYNIGLYLSNDFMGFVLTNFLEELWPFSKHALILGDDVGHKQNVMG